MLDIKFIRAQICERFVADTGRPKTEIYTNDTGNKYLMEAGKG